MKKMKKTSTCANCSKHLDFENDIYEGSGQIPATLQNITVVPVFVEAFSTKLVDLCIECGEEAMATSLDVKRRGEK